MRREILPQWDNLPELIGVFLFLKTNRLYENGFIPPKGGSVLRTQSNIEDVVFLKQLRPESYELLWQKTSSGMFDWFLNAPPCCAITDWFTFLKMGLFYSLVKTKKV